MLRLIDAGPEVKAAAHLPALVTSPGGGSTKDHQHQTPCPQASYPLLTRNRQHLYKQHSNFAQRLMSKTRCWMLFTQPNNSDHRHQTRWPEASLLTRNRQHSYKHSKFAHMVMREIQSWILFTEPNISDHRHRTPCPQVSYPLVTRHR